MEILNRLIGIDTEYHTNHIGQIDKVFCICATSLNSDRIDSNAHRTTFKKWTVDYIPDNEKSILDEISESMGISDPIYVCHSFELAERRALKFLGVDCSKYKFVCTWHLAHMLTFNVNRKRKTATIDAEIENKQKRDAGLSYASLCAKYKLALVDTEHKAAMRALCINDDTTGHEQEILDYCLEDTAYIIPLLQCLLSQYKRCLFNSYCPLSPKMFKRNIDDQFAIEKLILQTAYINDFGDIADNGIPFDLKRAELIKQNAIHIKNDMIKNFNGKYIGSFYWDDKDKKYKQDTKVIQQHLLECLKQSNIDIRKYPKTAKGTLKTDKDTLKDYFKDTSSFGEDLRYYKKLEGNLKCMTADDKKKSVSLFDYFIDGNKFWYQSLNPYGTKTGRCSPSTRTFPFAWYKALYGLFNPDEGKWLVELDYSSQETFCQACICDDVTFNRIYQSKDIYLAFAHEMSMVGGDDWDNDWANLPVEVLKKKYKQARNLIKPMILGLSYGMGAEKLSESIKISVSRAKYYRDMINKTIHKTTNYKSGLKERMDMCSSRALSLPDGFICQYNPNDVNSTTLTNWPFQSSGSMILRHVVKTLMKAIRSHELNITMVATIHDAIAFICDENDYETIGKVKQIMIDCANYILSANKGGRNWSIKLGEPDEIIKHNDIWASGDKAKAEQFESWLNYEIKDEKSDEKS